MTGANILKDSYFEWLKEKIIFEDTENGYVSIGTPFLDSNFDNINLYAQFINKDTIEVSDFGYTLYNLSEFGINVMDKRSKVANNIFNSVISSFGIEVDKKSLTLKVITSVSRFPIAKNRLLQAIMRINDIYYLSKSNATSSFNDVVTDFLEEHNILFTSNIEIPSLNGISAHFDFLIPHNHTKNDRSERLIRTATRPNDINQAKVFNFDVSKATRNGEFIYLLNDCVFKDNIAKKVDIEPYIPETALTGTTANIMKYSDVKQDYTLIAN